MNNKPYIEHNGTIYEFEADFMLRREFERDKQSEVRKAILNSGMSEDQYKDFKEIQDFIEKNQEKGLSSLSNDQKEKLSNMFDIIDNLNFVDLYDTYCFKMLKNKYNITRFEFNQILEGFAEEFGMEYVDILVQKVCDKVFTQQVEKKQEKKTLPTWMQ